VSGQLDLFKEYIGKLKGVVGEERAKFILANSLFIVVAGSSDISNTYRTRSLLYDLPSYSDLLLNSASKFLTVRKYLYYYMSTCIVMSNMKTLKKKLFCL